MKKLIYTTFMALIINPSFASNDTPDYWKCNNKSSGSWNFGRAPSVCDVDPFMDKNYVSSEYGPLVFEDSQSDSDSERRRYMTELYALIKEVSNYYIRQRSPDVDQEEIDEFIKASYTIAHQESYWSHYRRPVGKSFQMMRGDYGHGHGLYQVDDRWHFTAINEARGANIVYNIVYALEEYYDNWIVAPSKSCVSDARNWTQRARAAYSAYNGGAAKICRWTNPNDKWARNDVAFKEKYDQKLWEKYVDDQDLVSYLDIDCAMNEGTNCRKGEVTSTPKNSVVYRTSEHGNCFYKEAEETFYCVSDREQCLVSQYASNEFQATSIGKFDEDWAEYNFVEIDEDEVCSKITGLYDQLNFISVLKNINVRKTPGGDILGVIKSGSVAQVLDFNVSSSQTQDRYYKIKFGSQFGYVFAGNKSDYASWAKQAVSGDQIVAVAGSYVKTLHDVISLDKNVEILEGATSKVVRSFIDDKNVILELDHDGAIAQFLAGNVEANEYGEYFELTTLENDTPAPVPTPTPPVEDEFEIKTARLSKSIWWKQIKTCAADSCKSAGTIKGPKLSSKTFQVIDEQNGWYKVKQGSKVGWIKASYVKVL